MIYTKPFRVGNLTNGPIILGHVEAPITLAGCEPDITLSANPLGQEDTMNEPKLTAAELRQKHADLQAGLHRLIVERVRSFEAETGLEVYSINVDLATLRRVGEPAETVVASVDVRVGLGR